MGDPYIGEIRMFAGNFAPRGWWFCWGQILPIDEHKTLFQAIGATYGGDGTNNFALPDLRGRVPVGTGADYPLGNAGGVEAVTLTVQQLPAHRHSVNATAGGEQQKPTGKAFPAAAAPPGSHVYGPPGDKPTHLSSATIGNGPDDGPHNNLQPYLAITFIISELGRFPSPS